MKFNYKSQSGQSLIETIVAIFILVTALVAGLGLALYAVANSANAKNQIVASNLAREGIEVIRMMRDSNWLAAEDDNQIADLQTCTFPNPAPNNARPCYPETFAAQGATGSQFDLASRASMFDYITVFNNGDWGLESAAVFHSYFLCQQADGRFEQDAGSFGVSSCPTPLRYARKVTISAGSVAAPYTADSDNPTAAAGHSPEKIITSTVVWQGRKCTAFPTDFFGMWLFNPETFNTRCKLIITEHLTNWKDYQ